jgi:hypothetical protein
MAIIQFYSYAFALPVALLFNAPLVSTTCYNPDGTAQTSPAYQPCVQTVGTVSQCCGTNWTATDPRIANDICEPSVRNSGSPIVHVPLLTSGCLLLLIHSLLKRPQLGNN